MEVKNSRLTLALKKNGFFISAFPGQIILGLLHFKGNYVNEQVFSFPVFTLKNLCSALCAFFYFVNSNEPTESGVLCQISSNETYFWRGLTLVQENGQAKKICSFGIEKDSEVIFKIDFSLEELNNLICCINLCIPFTIFFSDIEFDFYNFLKRCETSNLNSEIIEIYANEKKLCVSDKQLLLSYFTYYEDLFKSAKCLQELYTEEH